MIVGSGLPNEQHRNKCKLIKQMTVDLLDVTLYHRMETLPEQGTGHRKKKLLTEG